MYIFYLNFRIEVNLKNSSQCSNGTIPIVLSGMYFARPGKDGVQRIQYMYCILLSKVKDMYKIYIYIFFFLFMCTQFFYFSLWKDSDIACRNNYKSGVS